MKGSLTIHVENRAEHAAHVVLEGSVDGHTFDHFRKGMQELIDAGNLWFVLDLGKMEYVASVGLNYLVNLRVQQRKKGGEVVMARPQPHVLKILKMLGLHEVLALTRTPEEAWGLLKSKAQVDDAPPLID